MKKRLFAWLLCVAILMVISPLQVFAAETVASGTCGENLTWTLDDAGTLTISGTGDMADSLYGSAPWYEHRESIKTVVIEYGATSIGESAFEDCDSLCAITIPESVTSIGDYAFFFCSNLYEISIPESVTSIGHVVFSGCSSLSAITIPEGVTSIGNSAFVNCSSLREITIPGEVTSIGDFAFYGCSSLTEITIPEGVTSIGNSAFEDCSSLTEITIPEGVTSIGYSAFYGCSSLTQITIPEGVTIIGGSAFYGCRSLTEIIIPEGVITIGDYAFYDCSSLTEITIPGSVTSIGNFAFDDCSSLTDVYYGGTETQWDELSNTPNATRIHYNCPAADGHWSEEQTPPTCVDSGISFETCSCGYKRNEESIPATGEHDYKSVVTPPTCEDAGYTTHTCANCGDTYTSDEVTAFGHMLGENNVCTVCGQVPIVASGECGENLTWTLDANGLLTISGTGDMADSLYGSAPWYEHREAIKTVVMEDGVTGIGNCAFYNCKELTEATIPAGVRYIGSGAFYECYDMRTITIPEGVTHIGDSAFYGCTSVQSITIPKGVTSIGESVFWNCTGLIEITIPEGIEEIGENTFYNCYNLREISIPEGVTHIGNEAFYNCNSLVSVTLPTSVTNIGYSAFLSCYKLSEIEIPEGVTKIEYAAFEYCKSLRAIVIPETVTSIDSCAFYGCSSLNEITIPAGVKSIGGSVFKDCSSLTDVYYGGTETQWDALSNTPDINRIHYDCPTADGHWSEEQTPPTCVDGGISFETCSCGYKRNEESIPATGEHDYKSVVTPPTCEDAGYTTHTCANCGDTYTSDEVTSLGHDFGEWETTAAPTCTEGGAKRRECSRCDHFETEEITATGHDYEAVVTSPTCEENGYTTYTCTSCGDTYTADEVTSLGHDLGEWETTAAPTCTEGGAKRRECSRCDHFETEEITATGHNYEAVVTPPTCEENGYTTYTCTSCGDTYTSDEVTSLGHDLGEWETTAAPTCTEGGAKRRECSRCDHFETEEITATGHDYEAVVTPPTCKENGYTTYTCANCGDTYTGDEIATEGHIWSDATCTAPMTCSVCHATEGDALGHDFGAWSVTKQPSVSEEGQEMRACSRCGHEESRTMEKLSNPFTDIPVDAFYYEAVMWAVENGITSGTSATEFSPLDPCLRAHVVTFLHRAAGNPEPTSTNNPFTDVASGSFFYKPVLWAVEKGITNGTSATEFGSYANCNRAAVVTFLWRAAGSPEPESTNNPFVDVATTSYYYKAVLWAVENGITNGVDATHFGPTTVCNRAQVVTFLYRAYTK